MLNFVKLSVAEKPIFIDGHMTRYSIRSNGVVWNNKLDIPMQGGYDKNGYHLVSLTYNKKKYTRKVHRLVALAFIPVPEIYVLLGMTVDNLEVNHKNGVKNDNDVSNLEWVTPAENTEHACKNGLRPSVLNKTKVFDICALLSEGNIRIKDIASKVGVSTESVIKIKNHYNWKRVTEKYDFSSYRFNRGLPGESNPNAKLSEATANCICEMLVNKISVKEISDKLGVSIHCVRNIKYKKTWKHLTKSYTFE